MIGQTLGSYRITGAIGEGGMGAVYRAEDVMLGREAAIKVLRPELAHDAGLIQRFRHEARSLALVAHPNVAALYGLFEESGVLFMAMEYARGEAADAMLKRQGALPWDEAALLAMKVLDGLDAAHRRGVIHRDLKPANLIVDETRDVKITDFGIARLLGAARHTRTGAIVGTLAYMAPEQVRGEEGDARTDIYAAGMVLYELLTGAVAFQRTSEYDLMRAVVEERAPRTRERLTAVPEWLDAIVMRALEKTPADRFQSAAEMRAAIAEGTQGFDDSRAAAPVAATRIAGAAAPLTRLAVTSPAPETRLASPAAAQPRWTRLRLSAAAAAIVIISAAGFFAINGAEEPKPAARPAAAVSPPASSPPPPISAPVSDVTPRPIVTRPLGDRIERPRAPDNASVPAEPVRATPSTPEPIVAEPAPPPPRGPALEPVVFDRIKLLQSVGGNVKEVDARLSFEADQIRITSAKGGLPLKSLSYRALSDATFSQSRHPRWKEGGAAAVAVGVFAAPLFFMKGTKHWLTLEAGTDFVVLRLDKNNYRMVLPALEARWGRNIAIKTEEK